MCKTMHIAHIMYFLKAFHRPVNSNVQKSLQNVQYRNVCSRKAENVQIIFKAVSAKFFEISLCGFSILISMEEEKK